MKSEFSVLEANTLKLEYLNQEKHYQYYAVREAISTLKHDGTLTCI